MDFSNNIYPKQKIYFLIMEYSMNFCRVFTVSALSAACISTSLAAQPLDLRHQSSSVLQSFSSLTASPVTLKEIRRTIDFNKTTHIHLQQQFLGYPVWGSNAIIHTPNGSNTSLTSLATDKNTKMNGVIYQSLQQDLGAIPATSRADSVLQAVLKQYKLTADNKQKIITETYTKLMVYVDKNNKAHWTYLVSFLATPEIGVPAKPTFIVDANNNEVYKQWNNLQTTDVLGGGYGGNEKEGQFSYDGLGSNYPKLNMNRNAFRKTCYLQNALVEVQDYSNRNSLIQFKCTATSPEHDYIYWNADSDAVNGAYSPANDALYIGKVVQEMYQKWYGIPPLVNSDGTTMKLIMRVHKRMENAYWDGKTMTFGDGGTTFYPLVSLGVGAHEISHGFTEQHSNLTYDGQSGGLNESFSDMASQAGEFYSVGKSSWQIGAEINKGDGSLRYMDEPTKDCNGGTPGNGCSISNAKDYNDNQDVHYTSGVFNKAFYLIASEKGWNNTHKAFNVMVKANQDYWTADTSFYDAACGVLKATADYKYDTAAVKNAFLMVGVGNLNNC
jgi:pseudolysin